MTQLEDQGFEITFHEKGKNWGKKIKGEERNDTESTSAVDSNEYPRRVD